MFVIGKQYGAFFCDIDQNDYHKNVACLIIFGKTADITVVDKSGEHHTGSTLLIKPLVGHTIISSSPVWQIYLAPYSAFAVSLYESTNECDISKLAPDVLPFNCDMSDQDIFKIVDNKMSESNPNIDPRLAAVLEDLYTAANPKACLTDIAKSYDISPSRLRVIAKEQIGVPLSALILWRKLVRSMKVLSSGTTLSEAAHAGGFSDQAHFTRTIRKMFGVTPGNTVQAFNYEK